MSNCKKIPIIGEKIYRRVADFIILIPFAMIITKIQRLPCKLCFRVILMPERNISLRFG